jgi:enoyl-CoA hydratase
VSDTPHLLVEREGHVVVVTMNRPDSRNAWDSEMLVRMADAWDLIDGDDNVRAAILTGASSNFCSGSDLKLMAGGRPDDEWAARFKKEPELHWKSMLRHHQLKKPLVAAVEGIAVGGGTEILQATDIRIAGKGARFGVPEVRWGLFPVGGSTVRLRRQIPYARAAELLLTGRFIEADEALAIGLIGRVVPTGQALSVAREVAQQIAENGPLAVQAVLRSLRDSEGLDEKAALAKELEIGWPILSTEDAHEGPRAFAEKRKPAFRGK